VRRFISTPVTFTTSFPSTVSDYQEHFHQERTLPPLRNDNGIVSAKALSAFPEAAKREK
jgi:hypothetical protein